MGAAGAALRDAVEETRRFVSIGLSTGRKLGPLVSFLTITGLRISEALALDWSDVDFDAPRVRVSKALVRTSKNYDILSPKTKAGRRDLNLPEPAVTALKLVRQRTGSVAGPTFRSANGEPLGLSHLRDALRGLCAEARGAPINVHGLRHAAAMLALEAVGDAYAVQPRLGHSLVGVTLTIYG